MRLQFLAAAAAIAMLGVPTAASAYQICAKVHTLPQNLSTYGGSIQVGTGTFAITYQTGNVEVCVDAGTFSGALQAKAGNQYGYTSCNFTVPAGTTAKVVIQVGIQYVIENKQAPYYVNSCIH